MLDRSYLSGFVVAVEQNISRMGENDHHPTNPDVKAAFWVAAKNGFRKFYKAAPEAWRGPESRFYRDEQRMVLTHVEPFYYGTMVGVFLFATFRISGSRRYLQFRDKFILRKNADVLPTQEHQKSNWKSHIEKMEEKQQSSFEEALSGPVDLLLSVVCAFSSAMWLSKPKRLVEDLSQSPLLPGRSLVYTCVCPEFIDVYDKYYEEGTPLPDGDDLLVAFQAFALNCKARSRVIATREENGNEQPDVIPYPGIKGVRRS